jgi:hypothetical protein
VEELMLGHVLVMMAEDLMLDLILILEKRRKE